MFIENNDLSSVVVYLACEHWKRYVTVCPHVQSLVVMHMLQIHL